MKSSKWHKRLGRSFKYLMITLLFMSTPLKAQRGFFFGIDAASGNFWTAAGIQLINTFANSLLKEAFEYSDVSPAIGGRLSYDILNFVDDNTKVSFNPDDWYGWRTVYGFRARDLFNHLVANFKVGWMGAYSPIGVYIHLGFDYRYFSMMLSYQTEAQDYRIGTFNPGIGIRISPSNFYNSSANSKFILEVGTNYNARVSFKGPYENDKNQLNNGLSYVVSLGIAGAYSSILLGVEWANHNLFKQDYTPDNGLFYPYYNFTSRITSIFLSINYGF